MKNETVTFEIPNLLKSNRNSPAVLLIRHGEKEVKEGGGRSINLTKTGKDKARAMGRKIIQYELEKVISSPFQRCVQTAEGLIEGASGSEIIIEESNILGDPGCYVIDTRLCKDLFETRKTDEVVYEYVQQGRLAGFRPLTEGSRMLLDLIIHSLRSPKGMTILVSHDAIIVPFVAYYLGYDFRDKEWLGFLEGPIIINLDGNLIMHFRGMETSIQEGI